MPATPVLSAAAFKPDAAVGGGLIDEVVGTPSLVIMARPCP